jgi:uncharacterized protein DUF5996
MNSRVTTRTIRSDPDLAGEWQRFPADGPWPATRDYLHLISQMLGKLRVALAPPLPEWGHTSLALTPRGLTTRLLPTGSGALEGSLDLVDGLIRLSATGGRAETVDLVPARTISAIWSDLRAALDALGVKADLWDRPQELADTTPFAEDDRARAYDPGHGRDWLALITDIHALFDAWRSPFFGRTGVNFWWGGFDLTVSLYNGRHAVPPTGSNYLMRHDLDAEHLTVGFWPGDDANEARFFGYLVPEPANCAVFPLGVASAAWAPTMEEWVLPYDAVRAMPDRHEIVRRFMDAAHRAAGELAGWDLDALAYAVPTPAPRSAADRG